jgi:hypothetical protein
LALLEEASGTAHFAMHATSSIAYGPRIHPLDFLRIIGFEHFQGECNFFHDTCLWRNMGTLPAFEPGMERQRIVQFVHKAFRNFVDKVERLYSLFQEQQAILEIIGSDVPAPTIFATPPTISILPTDIPTWVESIKFKKLTVFEQQQAEIEKNIKDLQEYLPLVFADGDLLVSAVFKALQLFKLNPWITEQGFTVDILAETQDKAKQFGFEVTGTNECIKKDSKKLTQVLEFERIKEHNEKTILIANTYRHMPVEERKSKEHFTQNVVEFLSGHPILLMTGYDLYCMVVDVLEADKNPDELIQVLHETNGVLKYP